MSPFNKLIKLSQSSFLLSRSIIVVGASMVSNVFSYLFQLISGRYLSVEDYSILVSLFSLSIVIPLFVQFLTSGIPKLVAEIKDEDYPHRISTFFFSFSKLIMIIAILIFTGMYIFSGIIASYLNISNRALIIVFAIGISTGSVASSFLLFLQGLMRFKAYSFSLLISSFSKFLVAVSAVLLGLGLLQIFEGLALTSGILAIIFIGILKKNITSKTLKWGPKDINTLLKYSFGTSFALIGISLVYNLDVIQAKHFFDSATAGIYGSLSIIGRIILFSATPVTAVMLPICASKYKKKENYVKPFLLALGLSTAIALGVSFVYWLFPKAIITMLFGEKYLPAAPYLFLFSIFMLLNTILSTTAYFLIAISRFKIAAICLAAPALQFIGFNFFNHSITEFLYVSIAAVSITLAGFLIMAVISYQRPRSKDRGLLFSRKNKGNFNKLTSELR